MGGFLENLIDILKEAVYIIPAILISLSVHECAHAWADCKLGDYTAKSMGRLTLNPLAHLDPLGTIMLLISSFTGFGFGWAKPVPFNYLNYRRPKLGTVLSALAGPVSNFLIALIATIIWAVVVGLFGDTLMYDLANDKITFATVAVKFMNELMCINIGLGVFNLLPFPPLDGSKILGGFLPQNVYFKLLEYENYIGIIFVLIILFKDEWISALLDPCFEFVLNILNEIAEPIINLFG